MAKTLEQTYEDRGYDVSGRGGSLILDTPNPRTTDDDYFHGPNPHVVGFGSRTAAHEGAWADQDPTVREGESTADVQQRTGGAGWGQVVGSTSSDSAEAGAPDESWRNADLQAYAEEHGIEVPANATKAELLDAIRG